jgi:hypothetical protein
MPTIGSVGGAGVVRAGDRVGGTTGFGATMTDGLVLQPGDAEVADLDHAGRRDDQVGRLHVPVDDAGRVRRRQTIARLRGDGHRLSDGQRAEHDQVGDAAPFHQLHHEVRVGAVATEVVDRDDVGVAEPGHGASLTAEPLDREDHSRWSRHRRGGYARAVAAVTPA